MRTFTLLLVAVAAVTTGALAGCTSDTEHVEPALPESTETSAPPVADPRPSLEDDAGAPPVDADAAPLPVVPRRVALFSGNGAGEEYVNAAAKAMAGDARFVVAKFADGTVDLSKVDVVVMPGGTASAEWKSLGTNGQSALRSFVSKGGGYVGVCAGFYLALTATAGFIPAEHYEPWARGEGQVDITIAPGNQVLSLGGTHRVRYVNGPIVPMPPASSPGYTVLATFAGNIGSSSIVTMKGKPAVVSTTYGQGRVVAFSPHPELSGIGALLADAVFWAGATK